MTNVRLYFTSMYYNFYYNTIYNIVSDLILSRGPDLHGTRTGVCVSTQLIPVFAR